MKLRNLVAFLSSLFFALACCGLSLDHTIAAEPRQPNIIFILADDLGWTDLGCMGSKYYETPNIDGLAAQGLKLMNHHHCQNCTPTRAALMSGQYPPRTGLYTVGSLERGEDAQRKMTVPSNLTNLPLDRKTTADQLKAAGYATAMFGKWHIGSGPDYHPSKRGFDEAIVSMGRHFDFITNPKVDYPPGRYLADFLTDQAVDFVERNKGRPFFLYLPHFGVHSPHQAKKELIANPRGCVSDSPRTLRRGATGGTSFGWRKPRAALAQSQFAAQPRRDLRPFPRLS